MQVPEARSDVHWRGRQLTMLGQQHFLALIRGHLDEEGTSSLMQTLNGGDR
jgi:hypothetical protein